MTATDASDAGPAAAETDAGPGSAEAAAPALSDTDPRLDAEADDGTGPRLLHPLLGSSLPNLVRVLRDNGPVPPRRIPHVAIALAVAGLRLPFTALERVVTGLSRKTRPLSPNPVFIVGHWRSGTTFLYTLLAQDPRFGSVRPLSTGLPCEFLTLGRMLGPLLEHALPGDRFIDRMEVRADSPQEDETALSNMQPLSFYHGLYFPRHFRENFVRGIFFEGCSHEEIRRWEEAFTRFLTKVAMRERQRGAGERLLVKNPVYTARVARLKSLFPGAKFIHIYRNPYRVFQSTRHFYRALFRELALQDWSSAPVDEVILKGYPRMMRSLLHDAETLAPDEFVHVRFEELEESPMAELEGMYDSLGLPGFDAARGRFAAHLEKVSDYRKNRYAFPPEALRTVEEHWGQFVERWGYDRPGPARA